jgi:superfamily II DNA/RNA helicase
LLNSDALRFRSVEKAAGSDFQILLFSATFDDKALNVARNVAPGAMEMLTQSQDDQVPIENVKQYVFHCPDASQKLEVLGKFLDFMTVGSCIIFANVRYLSCLPCSELLDSQPPK